MLCACFRPLLRDERGATATEYALIAVLIAVSAASVFASLGNELGTTYEHINTEVSASND